MGACRTDALPCGSGTCHNAAMTADRSLRVGTGVDVHTLVDDQPLWVAGLLLPESPRGLAGQSDGDVVAHAICDSALAAAGLGDLGSQFGTSDPRWSGASGLALLSETARRLEQAGAHIANVSVQLIGNQPMLGPRRGEAQEALSAACDASVTVTATTTDGLGLTGRGEGLAAIATALVWVTPR